MRGAAKSAEPWFTRGHFVHQHGALQSLTTPVRVAGPESRVVGVLASKRSHFVYRWATSDVVPTAIKPALERIRRGSLEQPRHRLRRHHDRRLPR
jgi:hypothetical protein